MQNMIKRNKDYLDTGVTKSMKQMKKKQKYKNNPQKKTVPNTKDHVDMEKKKKI